MTRISKWWILVLVGLAAACSYYFLADRLTLTALAQHEAELRELQQRHPVAVYGIAFGIYVLATGLSLPFATAMTLTMSWYFGFWRALVLISFASTAGATLAFLLSRYLFGTTIQQRFEQRLATFNKALSREGAFYLFTLRLVPAVPFFAINVVMGLTRLPVSTFAWVSQLGMLPGTTVYVYAGSRVPSLQMLADGGIRTVFTPRQLTQFTVAFLCLGLFPTLMKRLLEIRRHAVLRTRDIDEC